MENNKKKKISIIGSTGSIGTQALEVIEKLQDKFEIIALAGGHNVELLKNKLKNLNLNIFVIMRKLAIAKAILTKFFTALKDWKKFVLTKKTTLFLLHVRAKSG